MEQQERCPKCGSLNWQKDRLMVGGSMMNVQLKEKGFLKFKRDELDAFVCQDCGYIELYAVKK